MKKIIFVSTYLILMIVGIVIFLNVSENKYCLTYQGRTEFIGDNEIYISGLDNTITEECFNSTNLMRYRMKKIKEYTSIYELQIPNSINESLSIN